MSLDEALAGARTPTYVCSGFPHVYRDGAPPQEALPELDDMARTEQAGIRHVGECSPSGYYTWPVSHQLLLEQTSFGDELLADYAHYEQRQVPASALVAIRDAVVAHSVVYCTAHPEHPVLYETHRPNDRSAVHLVDDDALAAADRSRCGGPPRRFLYLGSAGSFNYGHWLVDDLPRAKAWFDLRADGGPAPIVVLPAYGHPINEVRLQSLHALLGPDVLVDFVDPWKAVAFDELHYATPVSLHPVMKSPAALAWLDHALTGADLQPTRFDRRLLVVRDAAHGRALLNLEEVAGTLVPYGLEVVDPSTMTFAEQVRTFREAELVVGQMGAAMVNTLFCRPASTIVHLAPEGWKETFYLDLAVARGQQHKALFGPSPDESVPPHLRDFTVPVQPVVDLLARMGLAAAPG